MFGYIRPFKPQMRICEYDIYKAVYCGLCKEMGKSFGFPSRFTLSYDFAFLGLLDFAVRDTPVSLKPQACMAHPLKKTPCVVCGEGLAYTAAAACISVYHKLKDDRADQGLKKKLAAALLLPLFQKSYRRARERLPALARVTEEAMREQAETERSRTASLDQAAEPTARITGEIAAGLSQDPDQSRILRRMGYLLGRYIYLCDALDDARDDWKQGAYNPLLLQPDSLRPDGSLNREAVRDRARDSVMFTLGELSNAYVLLNIEKWKPILDNVIYLGLKNTFQMVYEEKERKK